MPTPDDTLAATDDVFTPEFYEAMGRAGRAMKAAADAYWLRKRATEPVVPRPEEPADPEPQPRLTAAQAAEQLGIRSADRDAFMLLVTRMQTPTAQEAELRRLHAELDAVNQVLREAGFEYPSGAPGVQDLAAAYEGARAARDEAVNGDG